MNRQRRKRAEKAEARSLETGLQAPSRGNPVKHTGRPQGGPRGGVTPAVSTSTTKEHIDGNAQTEAQTAQQAFQYLSPDPGIPEGLLLEEMTYASVTMVTEAFMLHLVILL